MGTVSVISKLTAVASNVDGNVITLTSPSIVKLHLDRSDIASMKQVNHDLVITRHSGETITIKNFYAATGADANQLVLEDGQGALWWVQDTNGAVHFEHLDNIDALLALSGTQHEGAAVWPWVLGGLGAAAGIGLAAGGGGGGGGGGNSSGASTGSSTNSNGNNGGTSNNNSGAGDNGGTSNNSGGNDNSLNNTGTPPAAPAIVSVTESDKPTTPMVTSGVATNDSHLQINGTSVANAKIIIYSNGTAIGSTTADANGNWSYRPADGTFKDGQYQITATASVLGQESKESGTFVLVLDMSAPDAPHNLQISADGLHLSGIGEVGSTITITSDSGKVLGTVVVTDSGGAFTVDLSSKQLNGETLDAYATDKAGNTSLPGIIVAPDTTPPDAPVLYSLSVDGTHLYGQAEIGSTVTVTDGHGTPIGSVKVTSNDGSFTIDLNPAQLAGDLLTAVAKDAANNISLPSTILSTDLTPPTAPDQLQIADNGATLSGHAEAGSLVIITGPDTHEIGRGYADESGHFSIALQPQQINGELLSVTATDASHNQSLPATIAAPDITPPAQPVITALVNDAEALIDKLTNDATPKLTGTAEAHATVKIYDNTNTYLGYTQADGQGHWSFTANGNLPNGGHVFTAVAVDGAGNLSIPSAPVSVVIDTIPPTTPAIIQLNDAVSPAVGAVLNNGATNDPAAKLTGSGESGSTVHISLNGTEVGTALVDQNGVWSYTLSAMQSDKTYVVTATASDAAGNTSGISNSFTFTFDNTPPAAPVITSVTDDVGLYQGTINPLKPITDDTKPTLNGTAEKGAVSVSIYEGSRYLGSATVDSTTHAWSFTLDVPLTNGDHTLSVFAVDAAGNVSTTSADFTLNVDTIAPTAPLFTVTDDSSGIGLPLITGQVTKDTTPTLNGIAEAGSTVDIYDNGNKIGTINVDSSLIWSFSPTLNAGSHTLTATATDAAGNISNAAGPFNLYVQSPTATGPVIVAIIDDTPLNTGSLGDNQVTNDTTPILTGLGTAGQYVTVYVDGSAMGSVLVGLDGQWIFPIITPLSEGAHTFYVTEPDFVDPSPLFHTTIDITPPAVSTLVITDNTGVLKGPILNGTVTDETHPTISGKTEAGAQVIIYDNLLELGRVTADSNGNWSFTPDSTYAAGLFHSVYVTATDAAGNTSTSLPIAYTVFTVQPLAPTILTADDDVGTLQNVLYNGSATDDSRPLLHGTSFESNATIAIYDNGVFVTNVTTTVLGTWSWQPSTPLKDGPHSFTATVTNAIGVTSVASGSFTLTIDTVAPSAPIILQASDGSTPIVGIPTNKPNLTLSGTGEAGAKIIIYDNVTHSAIATTTVNADNSWSVSLTGLSDNTHALTATATDAAGNTSIDSSPFTVIVDTQPPQAPIIITVHDDVGTLQNDLTQNQVTDDNRPTLTGTAEPGATVTIYDGNKSIGQVKADALTGVWSFTPTTALADGSHTLTAKATDAAGNTGLASNSFTVVVDTAAPNAPVITTILDDTLPQVGNVADQGATNDVIPVLSGTAEKNTLVEIFDNGKSIGTTTADGSGNWTFTPLVPLLTGTHVLTAKATDAAGNVSGSSSSRTLTVDLIAPDAPKDLSVNLAGNILSGSAEAGSKVTVVSATGVVLGTGTADATGKFNITLSPTQSNGEKLSAYATDAAGNQGLPTDVYAQFSTLPGAPVISTIIDDFGSIQGSIGNGKTTDDTLPTLNGTAQARASVNIYDNGKLLATVTADNNGVWQYQTTTALVEGPHIFTATATNSTGTGLASAAITIIVDTTAPAAPDAQVSADGYSISNPTGTHTEANATITITLPNGSKLTVTADASGNWSTLLPSRLVSGETLIVSATDAAGNKSANTTIHAPTLPIAANDDIINLTDITTNAVVTVKQASGYGAQLINALGNTITVLADKVAKAEFTVDANNTGSATINAIATGTVLSLLSSQLIVVQVFDTNLQAWTTIVDSSQAQFANLLTLGASGISLQMDGLAAGNYRVLSYNTSILAVGAYTGINVTLTETTPGVLTETTPHQGNLLTEGNDVAPIGTVVSAITLNGVSTPVTADPAGTTINGKYGKLVINASGDYTYTLYPTTTATALGHSDSFTYTIVQGGVSSSANLVITLGAGSTSALTAVDDSVSMIYNTQVNAATAATLPASQTSYTIVSLGLGDVISVGLLKDMRNPTLLSVAEGTDRVITLQSSAGGVMIGATFDLYVYRLNVVTQQYELFQSKTNWLIVPLLGGKSDATTLTLPGGEYLIVMNSAQGLNLLGGYTITYLADYTYRVDSLSAAASGNVLSNDAGIAATGAHVTQVNGVTVAGSGTTSIVGKFGTLVIDANGNYTYTLKSGVSAGSITSPDSFIYTITAQNGTQASATLNIQPGAHALDAVDDVSSAMSLSTTQVTTAGASLIGAATTLAKSTSHLETDTTFTVAAGTALKAVSISFSVASSVAISSLALKWVLYEDGVQVATNSVAKGALTLFNNVNTLSLSGLELSAGHTYTLHLIADMGIPQLGAITITPSFVGTSYDLDNFLITGSHNVTGNIYDGSDAAGAMDQLSGSHTTLTISGFNGSVATLTPLLNATTTNPLSSLTSATITGHYGTLTVNIDGSYSYTLNSNVHPSDIVNKEVFTYTLNDQNGHTDTATLTINMNPLFTSTNQSDVIIGSAYGDTLIYNLLNSTDATGGNGVDHWSNFSLAQGDKIDIHSLLVGWDGQSSSLGNFLTVTDTGKGTVISIDRDGASGTKYSSTDLLVLDDVHNIKLSDLVEQNHIVVG
ncbi:TPA: BapA/Bap/LapF family large adhesin [Kluyvera georgiana]